MTRAELAKLVAGGAVVAGSAVTVPRVKGGRGLRRQRGEMNATEARYAQHLELLKHAGDIEYAQFEPFRLRLADNTTYTPDFLVMRYGGLLQCHDVKGTGRGGRPYVEDDASVKIKVAAELFPFEFLMVWEVRGEWKSEVV